MKVILRTKEGDATFTPSVPLNDKELADMKELGMGVQVMNASEGAQVLVEADTSDDHMKGVVELFRARLIEEQVEPATEEAPVEEAKEEKKDEDSSNEVVESEGEETSPEEDTTE